MNPDHANDVTPDRAPLDRAGMEQVAEQILRERLPLHEVDQYMASLRELVEFKVFAHNFDENSFRSVTMWSINVAEAASEALNAFEHDGWLVTNVIRVSDNPYMHDPDDGVERPPRVESPLWAILAPVSKPLWHVAQTLGRWTDRLSSAFYRFSSHL